MPWGIDIKNRTPVADGHIAGTVITVVSPVQCAVIEQITVHVSLPLIVEESPSIMATFPAQSSGKTKAVMNRAVFSWNTELTTGGLFSGNKGAIDANSATIWRRTGATNPDATLRQIIDRAENTVCRDKLLLHRLAGMNHGRRPTVIEHHLLQCS